MTSDLLGVEVSVWFVGTPNVPASLVLTGRVRAVLPDGLLIEVTRASCVPVGTLSVFHFSSQARVSLVDHIETVSPSRSSDHGLRVLKLRNILEYLNRRGKLGQEIHDQIDAVLAETAV